MYASKSKMQKFVDVLTRQEVKTVQKKQASGHTKTQSREEKEDQDEMNTELELGESCPFFTR